MINQLINPMKRRNFLGRVAATLLVGGAMLSGGVAHADGAHAEQATQLVQRAGDQLVQVINDNEAGPTRTAAMQKIIDEAIDVDNVARFCLGRYVHAVSPDELQQYIGLFGRIMAIDVSAKLGEYRGVKYKVLRTETRGDDVSVATLITRPNSAPNTVQWIVDFRTGQPKIIDLVAEGTSLRLTQRSDYASFLARNNNDVKKLIAGMRRQTGG